LFLVLAERELLGIIERSCFEDAAVERRVRNGRFENSRKGAYYRVSLLRTRHFSLRRD
jgi:hypothetical protein